MRIDIFEIKKVIQFLGIIPARYKSTRFPGKPLAMLGSKPMLQWVYESAKSAFKHLVVATDDSRIRELVESFGGNVVMTSVHHTSGTERCAEALKIYSEKEALTFSHVINIQGDEPFIKSDQLNELAECFNDPEVQIATLIRQVREQHDLENPNVVKVTLDALNNALYFSRSSIPHVRGKRPDEWLDETSFFAHLGLYGFRSDVLEKVAGLNPTSLELAESLEQLRWLQHGIPIRTRITNHHSPGVDTPEDLEKLRKQI
jgi:3-deoxy-manno-octulosonate cytidylyltransferase (CMP-KDO synthetase)